jgi:diguanylate cyclase (GGDEF)-like protein
MTSVRRRASLFEPQSDGGPTWWSLSRVLEARRSPGMRRIAAVGLAVNLLSVGTAAMNVAFGWNGLPVRVGPAELSLTVYPPLLLSVLAAVWIGPGYGVVPAYLANLTSALGSGIPLGTSLLFAFAGAIETLIVWGSMVVLGITPDLRRRRDAWRFAAVSLIAASISSLAVLVWNSALSLDFATGQRVWRGWVLGDWLQLVLVVAPLLRFAGAPARGWIDRQFAASPHHEITFTRAAAFAVVVFGLMSLLVFVGIAMLQSSLDIPPGTLTVRGELLQPRLFEIQLFLALLVVALMLTTGVFSTALASWSESQRSLARRESLTGCFNRRAFYELFQREADRSRRLGEGLTVVFLDIDHFKPVNDRHGHEVGDRLLQQLAIRVQGAIRETDLLFRWGGEEFLLLLPHTAPAEASALAERVRAAVAERGFPGGGGHGPLSMTVSLGIAGTMELPVDPDALVAEADAACYRAKAKGRNRVEGEI